MKPPIGRVGEDGFTLVELSVAASVSILALALLFSAYGFAVRWVETWRDRVALENDAHLVLRRLSNDLWRAGSFAAVDARTWILHSPDEDTLVYRLAPEGLFRNGHPLHAPETTVAGLRLTPSRPDAWYAPLTAALGGDTLRVHVRVSLRRRGQAILVETEVVPRPVRPWRPLPPPGQAPGFK